MAAADLTRLSAKLESAENICSAIVETPRGSRSKYDYDPKSGLFQLSGVLPAGMAFPLDFGFVPGTRAEDGDPLDILLLADEVLPVGCLVTAHLLGVIEARQTEHGHTVRNDRLVGKIAQSRTYADIVSLEPLGEAFVAELIQFFETYNNLKNKRFEATSVGGPARAVEIVVETSEACAGNDNKTG